MIEVASDEQKRAILETVGPELANIALNMHGTRAVQKLIENWKSSSHVSKGCEIVNDYCTSL